MLQQLQTSWYAYPVFNHASSPSSIAASSRVRLAAESPQVPCQLEPQFDPWSTPFHLLHEVFVLYQHFTSGLFVHYMSI